MKSVTQKHSLGCSIACAGFIGNRKYNTMLKFFKNSSSKTETTGFLCKDIIRALHKIGLNYTYRYINNSVKSSIYRDGMIVFIKRNKNYPTGHYLARKNNRWMDPWINFSKNKDIKLSKSGFRKRLPGHPIYAILPN